jgi:large subunit ribosomal protein L30
MMVQQYRSLIRTPEKQRRIVKSLGFRRLGQIRDVKDNAAIRGMLRKVPHIIKIISQESSL